MRSREIKKNMSPLKIGKTPLRGRPQNRPPPPRIIGVEKEPSAHTHRRGKMASTPVWGVEGEFTEEGAGGSGLSTSSHGVARGGGMTGPRVTRVERAVRC